MNPDRLKSFLKRERRRLQFYKLLEALACGLCIFFIGLSAGYLSKHLLFGFKISILTLNLLPWAFGFLGALMGLVMIYRTYLLVRNLPFEIVAYRIERQSKFFQLKPQHRTELISAASFFRKSENNYSEFESAHLQSWSKRLSFFSVVLFPPVRLTVFIVGAVLTAVCFLNIQKNISYSLPNWIQPWSPTKFEVRLPFADAEWKQESGAMSGISGSDIRFEAPNDALFRTFLYVKEAEGANADRWTMIACEKICELKLHGRGQYAVGSLFWRSSVFPLQVNPDEAPKGALLVKIDGEWQAASTVEVLNKKLIELQATASDDILLKKVELVHHFQDVTEALQVWNLKEAHFKTDANISMEGWKGGAHEIYLKMSDELQTSNSSVLTIFYADENTLREKRLQNLRALLDEWVHVLGDLLETQNDKKLKEGLITRVRSIEYAEVEDNALINAYVKELHALGLRIENWARLSPDLNEVKDLITRTEKALLYGLSLIFQEKTGEVEATANNLKNSQADLSKLLQQLKDGKLDLDSKELEEAFKKMAQQLEEMQKKIRELPQGPQDELLNREALEAQADESDSLAQKIEEIKKQMASGDSKGALRELESLLNQLSILSKEMERSLDQWKSNLDQGAMQAQEKFLKKLEEIKKRQQELAEKTEKLKDKSEKLEEDSQKTWKPIEQDKLQQMGKEFKKLEGDQDKITKEFQKTVEEFDQALQGSEWQPMFRNAESNEIEKGVSERMVESKDGLAEQKSFDSLTHQKEALELLNKLGEGQKKLRDQAQQPPASSANGTHSEKIEIKGTDKQLDAEKKRKIMESLRQKVDDRFQKSHEHYFEELLQR